MKSKFRHELISLCLMFLFFFPFFHSVRSTITNFPSSFFIEFEGVLNEEDHVFLVVFTNGSSLAQKNLTMNFSMHKIKDNNFIIGLVIETEDFVKQLKTDGYISNGQLQVNSIPSLFMLEQNLLEEGDHLFLAEIMAGKIFGNVSRIGTPSTAIDNHRIEARVILTYHEIDSDVTRPLTRGFDPETGLLVYAGGALSDVLLEEMGIKYIYGGLFNLKTYSDDLDFVLIEPASSPSLWILLFTSSLLFIILTISIYFITKRNKMNMHKKC